MAEAVAEAVAWLRAAIAAAKSGSEANSPCADARLNCTLRELSAIRVWASSRPKDASLLVSSLG